MKFENYRHYLENEFEKRRSRNPSYSLRSLARDLEIPPSRLSEAINGKRGISLDSAESLIKNLKLEKLDADIFRLSVEAEHSRSKLQKMRAREKLNKILEEPFEENLKVFTMVDWIAEVLLKMSERQSITEDSHEIATKLGVPHFMVVSSLRFLTRLGLVKGTKKYKTYLEDRGVGRRLNIDYTQILEQAQKAYVSMRSAEDAFHHQAFLLEKKDAVKANKLLMNCLFEIKKLEKKTKKAKVVFIANQIFSLESWED